MEKNRVENLREEDGGYGYRQGILEAFSKRSDLSSWTYTHAWREPEVCEWRDSLPPNVGCVASLNSLDDVPEAVALGWKSVAVVTPTADGKGFTADEARDTREVMTGKLGAVSVLPCPAQRPELSMGCSDCMACMRTPKGKVTVIVFAVHGPGKKKAACSTGGCYAQHGNVAMHQRRSLNRHMDIGEWVMTRPYYSLVRLSVSGDVWTEKDDRPVVQSPEGRRSLPIAS